MAAWMSSCTSTHLATGTCFCASMGTGPIDDGYDLRLTELLDDGDHRFLVRAGSERGADVLTEVPHTTAGETDVAAAAAVVERRPGNPLRRWRGTDGRRLLIAPWPEGWDCPPKVPRRDTAFAPTV
jgi:hypothetical protein